MEKGSYYERLLHKKKKELLERIEYFLNITTFFIHALSCCLNNVFRNNLSDNFKIEFKKEFDDANDIINKYEKKNNRLIDIIDWLINLDEVVKVLHEQKVKLGKNSSFNYYE